jgi:hypothetical protein
MHPLQRESLLQSTLSHTGEQCIPFSLCWLQGDHGGARAELAACKTSLRELSIRGAARGPNLMAALAGASLPIMLRLLIPWSLVASFHIHGWQVAVLMGRASGCRLCEPHISAAAGNRE